METSRSTYMANRHRKKNRDWYRKKRGLTQHSCLKYEIILHEFAVEALVELDGIPSYEWIIETKEACEIFGWKKSTLYQHWQEGRLPTPVTFNGKAKVYLLDEMRIIVPILGRHQLDRNQLYDRDIDVIGKLREAIYLLRERNGIPHD